MATLLIFTLVLATVAYAFVVIKRLPAVSTQPNRPQTKQPSAGKSNWLLGLNSYTKGKPYCISSSRTMTVGRAVGNDIQIPHNSISRCHARLSTTPTGMLVVTDLGSRNGTFVNSDPIVTHILKEGDEIQFAGIRFSYVRQSDVGTLQARLKRQNTDVRCLCDGLAGGSLNSPPAV